MWTVAVDDTEIYAADGSGKIVACAKSGCPMGPRVVASGAGMRSMGIAVDATHVYWATTSDGTILSAPKGGGPVSTVETGGYPYEIAVDATDVYWADNDGPIAKAPKGGGLATVLADMSAHGGGMAIALDDANVYFGTSDGYYWQISKSGGKPLLLATDGGNEPWGIAVDARNVYYVSNQMGSATGAVKSVPIGGGCVTTLASAQGFFVGVAVDASHVYFTTLGQVLSVGKP
jgi:hypothetical protein